MDGCSGTCVRNKPINVLYFEFENDLKFYDLGARSSYVYIGKTKKKTFKRGSCMVWEINMGVCPRLDFENIMLFNCLGYNFNIYGAFEFLCKTIANL